MPSLTTDSARKPMSVFISYAHADQQYAQLLRAHLEALRRANVIEIWSDRVISAGTQWAEEIDSHLRSSQIILLLISADFLASGYCYGNEAKTALGMHDAGEATVIPIIVRPCMWQSTPFAKLQVLPRDGRALTTHSNLDGTLVALAQEVRRVAESTRPAEGLDKDGLVEIQLGADFSSFTPEQERSFLDAVRSLLKTNTVRLVGKRKGSVILKLKLGRADLERLRRAAQEGELEDFNFIQAHVVSEDAATAQSAQLQGKRPRIFIGSSSEGLEVAENIQVNLDDDCEVTVWKQGHFGLGSSTLESLVTKLNQFDFAVLVLTPDDLIETRGDSLFSPRDNVVFELGLFMGHLGRERTIVIFDRTADLKLPSDLAGVTSATYQPHSSGNLEAALGAPCTRLKKHIRQLGARDA